MKTKIAFPPIESADKDGLLALGGDLSLETLKQAYLNGIFPWPISDDAPLTWFSPDPRGILNIEDFHIPRSLKKALQKSHFKVTFNKYFEEIISNCAEISRKNEPGTWIRDDIVLGYTNLFKQGHAYSVEVHLNEKLVGGLYGVCFGELISGESMFYTETNASKFALVKLVEKLTENNIQWIDTQMVSPLLKSMGAINISRDEFKTKLMNLTTENITRDDLFYLKNAQ